MKTYSGSTSEGFLPAALPATGAAATAVAPAPEDPSSTFADALEQQQTPKTPAFAAWTSSAAVTAPNADASPATPTDAMTASAATLTLPAATLPTATEPAASSTAFVFPAAWTSATTTAPSTGSSSLAAPVVTPDEGSSAPESLSTPLSPYGWLGQPALATPRAATTASPNPTPTDDASANESENDSETLSLLTSAPRFSAPNSTGTPASPASGSSVGTFRLYDDDGSDLTSAGGTTPSSDSASTRPPTFSTPQRAALSFASTAWTSASLASPSAPAPASASSTPAGPVSNDADCTGAAIVASVFGRALTDTRVPSNPAASTAPQPASTPAATAAFPVSSSLAGSPLATIIAHATILAASPKSTGNAPAPSGTASAAASSTPSATSAAISLQANALTGSVKPSGTPHSVEKKSASASPERSFLQENASVPTTLDPTASLLQAAISSSPNLSGNQLVTPSVSTPSVSANGSATASISAAGMANGKKMDDMNMTPGMTSLVVSSGTHPLVTSTSADLHIALASNHDFTDALDQVMHVAELSNMSRATPPLRVAIEIQTPPGAIVNVYVSRQSDSSYRAQLSTNDPQALAWVQNQIGTLKGSTEAGSAIRWSPAQLEPGTPSLATSSGSTGSDRGYDWDRGGQQDQSGYQQEERPPRPALVEDEDEPALAFAATFGALGGVA